MDEPYQLFKEHTSIVCSYLVEVLCEGTYCVIVIVMERVKGFRFPDESERAYNKRLSGPCKKPGYVRSSMYIQKDQKRNVKYRRKSRQNKLTGPRLKKK